MVSNPCDVMKKVKIFMAKLGLGFLSNRTRTRTRTKAHNAISIACGYASLCTKQGQFLLPHVAPV